MEIYLRLEQMKIKIIRLVAFSALLLATSFAQAGDAAQNQVKALFLYNFANFVEWPDTAFSTKSSPLRLCLYGNVPFGGFLDAVNGTLIGDRKLEVVRATEKEDIENGCHILYVGLDKKIELPTFFKDINYQYVLSVGERADFVNKGGIINIVRTTDQVNFDINISNALNNGLWVSSDLLSLAREIKRINK